MAKQNQKNLFKFLERIEAAEKDRDNKYRDKWARFYKRWRNIVNAIVDEKGKAVSGRSNISIPYSFVQLETILPRLVETLFAARPYVAVKGRPKNREEYQQNKEMADKPWNKTAAAMEMLLDHQQNIIFDIQDKFHIGLKILLMYGTTVAYVGWKYEEKKQIKRQLAQMHLKNPVSGILEPMFDEANQPIQRYQPFSENLPTYDDPDLKFLDLGLFYIDPNAEDVESGQYCGHVCFETKEYLQSMHDQGIWNIDWKKIPKDSKRNEAKDFRNSQVGIPADTGYVHDDEKNLYEIHYYWEDDKCVVLINRAYIAMEGPNPFEHLKKPYVSDTYIKDPGNFYGIGVMENIEDLQDELNVERNQRIDFRSASLRRTFTQLRGATVTPANWEIKANGRILVDDHGDIAEMKMNPLPADSFNEEHVIKGDMQDVTGAQDVVMGTSGASETATTTMSKDNNASMRFKLVISSIEKRLLVGVSRFMIQLNQQFIGESRLLDMDGDQTDEFIELSPDDIQGEFRLIAAGSSVEPAANKEAFKQRMVELYSIVSKDPFMQQFPIKRRNLLKKVFEVFQIKDTDDLLPTDEELQLFEQNQLMQAQQEAQAKFSSAGGQANTAMQSERGLQLA